MKERRGLRDFLVRAPHQAIQGCGGSAGLRPHRQLWGIPPAGDRRPAPPRAAGRSPACARTPPPRPGDPSRPPAPRAPPMAEGARQGRSPSRGHRAAALTNLVWHPCPLVTAQRLPRASGAARAENQTGPRPSRGQGPKGGAGRAVRGGGGPRPGLRGRLAPFPARCR